MALNTLPQELIGEVVAQVALSDDGDDICNLRLVNQHCASVAGQALFDSVSIWLEAKSLKRLTKISETRSTIKFSPLQIDTYEYSEYAYFPDDHYHKLRKTKVKNQKQALRLLQLIDDEAQHEKYWEMQNTLLHTSGAALEILRSAFRQLPCVHTIDIDLADSVTGAKELMNEFKLIQETLSWWDSAKTLPILFDSMMSLPGSVRSFRIRYGEEEGLHCFDRDMIREHRESGASEMGALAPFTTTFNFAQLERLELSHDYQDLFAERWRNHDHFDDYFSATKNILRKALRLKHVKIQIPPSLKPEHNNQYKFTESLSQVPFSYLQTLELINLRVMVQQPLSKMLDNRFFALEKVSLEFSDQQSDWTAFVTTQRRAGWQRLEVFEMSRYCPSHEPICWNITAYVSMKTDQNPMEELIELA
ncbi:uncharacterized protein KY384_006269 [Bacidia gigantensis]|uniref:uncharacterized protein n=1 Tax=Bacidia gigantensis TaxID=2732470 RepID=UPI001D04BC44|nr:uncharacterized protein KY384_006269 [Bacidia gigantensis]KAG8528582.1 hypothetical protein KY384_006269 [Bacidia gigantensis]